LWPLSNKILTKLFVARFFEHVEEATWLSPIGVVLKKNGKFIICVDFRKLNVATKKIHTCYLLLMKLLLL
jgi:hypothetical protein